MCEKITNGVIKNTSTHNYNYDFLKFYGTVFIILHHSQYLFPMMQHGHMFVELFFMISGFFLAASFESHRKPVKQHIKTRFLRIYPKYIIAMIIVFILQTINKKTFPYEFKPNILFEALMLQNIGIPKTMGLNNPCWYISVMFYSDLIIFLLLSYLPKKVFVILASVISSAVFVCQIILSPSTIEYWEYKYIFYLPFWRGFSEMMAGCLIFYISNKIKGYEKISAIIKSDIAAYLLLLIVTVLLFFKRTDYIDYVIYICIFIMLISFSSEDLKLNRFLEQSSIKTVFKHQYSMFLNHAWILAGLKVVLDKVKLSQYNIPSAIICVIGVFFISICFDFCYSKTIGKIIRH